ncbi:hypothetical protein [Psychrobium sp. 1_MG-2023]|uniref:hypothetical protein n=1 Tax=Psychrobium sp. 1_MG-2023 TaxID=3062624 RepID=UPI000C3441F9|nr:hypothetical protein [Psychrobium sp. 1_MG-2023]MDP2560638.1 hypothetical protein [Psychrobium sp. 1_MG-2023]PKF56536.1 hypothetical protein CW748_08605 [Alteromonadales bacterium alter-6D02]
MKVAYRVIQVEGGYDLEITHQQDTAVLFIGDKQQAQTIAQQIIALAEERNVTILAACALFNQGTAMYPNELLPY